VVQHWATRRKVLAEAAESEADETNGLADIHPPGGRPLFHHHKLWLANAAMKTGSEERAVVVVMMVAMMAVVMMLRRVMARNEWAARERRVGLCDDDQSQESREQFAEHD